MGIKYDLNTKMIKQCDDENYKYALPNGVNNFKSAVDAAFKDIESALVSKYGSEIITSFHFFVDNAVSTKSHKKNKRPYSVNSFSGKTPYLQKLWTIEGITYFLLKLNIENGSDKCRIKTQINAVLTSFDFTNSTGCSDFITINPMLEINKGSQKIGDDFLQGINEVKDLYMARWETEFKGNYLFIDNATKKGKYLDITNKCIKKTAVYSGWTPTCYPVNNSRYHIIRLGITPDGEHSEVVQQFAHEFTHWIFFVLNGKEFPVCPYLSTCGNGDAKTCKRVPSESNYCEEAICNAAALILLEEFCTLDSVEVFRDLYRKSPQLYYQRGDEIATYVGYDFAKLCDLILDMISHYK